MKPEKRFFNLKSLEIRKVDGAKSKIGGYVTAFDKLSENLGYFREVREKIKRGAFKKSLKEDDIRAFWNHNSDIILGRNKSGTLELSEDDYGLSFELDLPDTQAGRDAFISIERGDVTGMSFGFIVRKEEVDTGDNDTDPILRTLLDVQLFEVSPVIFPAYPASEVEARSLDTWAKDLIEKRETEKKQDLLVIQLRQNKLIIAQKDAFLQKKLLVS